MVLDHNVVIVKIIGGICDNYKENRDVFFKELKKYVREKSKAYYESALIIKKCAYPKMR